MAPPRLRITVRQLMAAVALIGVVAAAYRAHISLGSFLAGVISVALLRNKVARRSTASNELMEFASYEGFAALALTLLMHLSAIVAHDGAGNEFRDIVWIAATTGLALAAVRFGRGWGRWAGAIALGLLGPVYLHVIGIALFSPGVVRYGIL